MIRDLYVIAKQAPLGFAGWCGRCGRRITSVTSTVWTRQVGDPDVGAVVSEFRMSPCGCGPYPDPVDRSWWIYAPVYPPEWNPA